MPESPSSPIWRRLCIVATLAIATAAATLSTHADRDFWSQVAALRPGFSGMAFQVLTRIAPEDALNLLSHLPGDKAAVGSVARKLPEFVSQFEPAQRAQILGRISTALASLTPHYSRQLTEALEQAGFRLPHSGIISGWDSGVISHVIFHLGIAPKFESPFLGSHVKGRRLA